jgi:hypothetical protein
MRIKRIREKMKVLAAGTFLLPASLLAQQPPLAIPQIADGGGWKSTVVIFNSFSLNPARISVIFRGNDGARVPFPIDSYGVVSSLDLELMPQSSLYLQTSGTSPAVQSGWVEVDQIAGDAPVKGFAIFRQSVAGRPDFEAVSQGMRPAGSMTFPFDNTNGFVTSFAVVNFSSSACTVAVSPIYDEWGNPLSATAKLIGSITPNGHAAFIATDKIPEIANKRGYLTFTPLLSCGSAGMAMLGLRFNSSGPFTNLQPLSVSTP